MLSGKDKVIGESPMTQHSPGAIEFMEDSVKCRQRATTLWHYGENGKRGGLTVIARAK